jgi:predicted amidohydrolase
MAARDRVKVAAAQYPIDRPGAMQEWRDKTERWVREGADTGAKILIFPEYGMVEAAAAFGVTVAADLQRTLAAVAEAAANMDALYVELARQFAVHILAPSGPLRRADGRLVNAARVITPAGRTGVQEKLILTPFERVWGVASGHPLRVFETEIGRIGVAICYDSEFPLLVRAQAEAGAELILIPSCTEYLSGYHRVRAAAQARALESQIGTVVSPTVGDAPWSAAVDRNVGAAGVFVPADQALSMSGVLVEGALNAPGWVAAEVDLAALRRLRTGGETRNHVDWPDQPGATPWPRGSSLSISHRRPVRCYLRAQVT